MQRNKSNEIARDIIRTAKETFNEKINNITLFNLTDEPYKMFSIKLNIPVRQHRKSGRRETVCPGLRKPLMRVYSRNVLSKP